MNVRDPTLRVISYNRYNEVYDRHMPRVVLEDDQGYLEVHFWPEEGDMFAGRGQKIGPCTAFEHDEDIRCPDSYYCGGPIVVLLDFREVWMSDRGPRSMDEAHQMQDELMADPAGWLMEHRL